MVMSWLVGALQGLGGLTDVASTISGMVYQHRHLEQLKRQNDLQEQWMARNEQLQRDAMQLSRDLAIQAPALRVQAAINAGFDVVSARQLAGSGERRINGYLEQPVRTIDQAMAIQSRGNLTTLSNALSTFQNGTQFGMKAPKNFSRPNYNQQSRPPFVNLGPSPPSTNV
ncbi:putative minor structural protein [Sapporo virus]|uniref:Capsid protein n=1 Tax=Sapporo virus TaxID=95342 RepID=A0A1J0MTN9_9CALI|nr:capsid protein [Sapporo virus]AQM55648.1 putative minor structural protein [Sapporo virus]